MEMKAASSPSAFVPTANFLFDEERWLTHMQDALTKQKDVDAVPSIFDVPKALLSTKPEAYAPHVFAVGPYHKRRHELYEMERWKADVARRAVREILGGLEFEQLVRRFTDLESNIRAFYHRYLDYNKQTVAWMMAIDACFVLLFLRDHHHPERKVWQLTGPPEMTWVNNAMVRDIMMLENQIPLCLLEQIVAAEELSEILEAFISGVSPFKKIKKKLPEKRRHHLLAILYDVLTPNWEDQYPDPTDGGLDQYPDPADGGLEDNAEPEEEPRIDDQSCVNLLQWLPSNLKDSKPVKLFQNTPFLNFLKQGSETLLGSKTPVNAQPLIEEIRIPSVTDLAYAGVRFVPAEDGIAGIDFDAMTRVFRLPVISLDDNTEVIMRNLVAYEATTVHRQLIFARYTELMNGIIDTEQDLQLLRESKIIEGDLGNKKAVDFWNGMNKSVRATKVSQLDKHIIAVNEFYDNIWSVKTQKLMTRTVFRSWKLLTLLSAVLLLLMTGMQAFCSVYTCARWFGTVKTGK